MAAPRIQRVRVEVDGEALLVECYQPFKNDVRINVWKQTPRYSLYNGGTFMHIADLLYIQVGTDPNSELYSHLQPGSNERHAAVQEAYRERYTLARKAITIAFKIGPALDWKDPDHQSFEPCFMDGEWRGFVVPEVQYWSGYIAVDED